jgi:glycosyltransferase involved in cell wall biosynthesis
MKLPGEWGYTEQDVCELLDTAAIIVTSESGVAVEAAAMGVSVIIVASQSGFTCNPMLETGRGRIWDIVFDVHELETTYSKLLEYRADNISGIRELAEFYKGACFVEPTEENIVQAFDLCEKGVRS